MGSPIRTTERKLHLCRAARPLLCHLLGKPADSSQLVLASGLWLFDARYLNLSDAAAHRFRQLAFSHCLTQPVVHECGFQTNAKGPVQLVAADPFLAVAHQEGALEPDVQPDMVLFENGADLDRELLPAIVALPQPYTGRPASEAAAVIDAATMRADRALRPENAFQLRKGGGFVVEARLVENAHDRLPI